MRSSVVVAVVLLGGGSARAQSAEAESLFAAGACWVTGGPRATAHHLAVSPSLGAHDLGVTVLGQW